MRILRDLIESVKQYDMPVKRAFLFLRCAYIESRGTGIASILHNALASHAPLPATGRLHTMSALELAELSFSVDMAETAVGIAAINSLTSIDEARCTELNAHHFISERGKGKTVGIIGHFPFVDSLRADAGRLYVFEKHPQEGDYPEEEIPRLLPECDVIGITGTTLLNHSLPGILAQCAPGSIKILLGPSTVMNPVLFDYGIDVLAGTAISDSEAAFRHLGQGGTFQKIPGARLLTMSRIRP